MIHAVIAVLVEGLEDFMLSPGGELIARALNALRQCPDVDEITICCNHPRLLSIPLPGDVVAESIPASGGGIFLARPGVGNFLLQNIALSPKADAILVLSPRNPLVTEGLLKQAIDSFMKNVCDTMISVAPSVMHPCQLFYGRPATDSADPVFLPDEHMFAERVFFPEIPGLWVRGEDGAAVNQVKGRKILGRQDFPETVEPDGSFLMVRRQCGCGFFLDFQHASGFRMPLRQSIQIRTRFDYLRYLVMKKAGSIEAENKKTKEPQYDG